MGSLAANMACDEDDGGDGGGGDGPGADSSSDVARRWGHVISPDRDALQRIRVEANVTFVRILVRGCKQLSATPKAHRVMCTYVTMSTQAAMLNNIVA